MKLTIKTCFSLFIALSVFIPPHTATGQPFAYIPNSGSNTVSVFDEFTNSVLDTITVGNAPRAVTVNETGTRAYVANSGDNTVSVIDTVNNSVVATIPVGQFPRGLSLHPNGNRLYVVNSLGDSVPAAIDGEAHSLGIMAGGEPVFGGTVSVIDTESSSVIQSIPTLGRQPRGAALHPTGRYLFVTHSLDNTLSVIDTLTNTAVQLVPVGIYPLGVSVHPNGEAVFVANASEDTFAAFKLADLPLAPNGQAISANDYTCADNSARNVSAEPQVLIEVRFLQTQSNFFETIGIMNPSGTGFWTADFNNGSVSLHQASLSFPFLSQGLSSPLVTQDVGGGSEGLLLGRARSGGDIIYAANFSDGMVQPLLPQPDGSILAPLSFSVGPNPVEWGDPGGTTPFFERIQIQNMETQKTAANARFFSAEGSPPGLTTVSAGMESLSAPLNPNLRTLAANGSSIQYEFFYRAGYGTPAYDSNPWVIAQDFSDRSEATVQFPGIDNYIVVIHAVADPEAIPSGVPIIGMSVNTGAGTEDVQFSGLAANLPGGTPRVGDFITFIAGTAAPDTVFFRFHYRAGYGTPAYDSNRWVLFQDFSTKNAATIAFPTADHYIVVVHAVADPNAIPTPLPMIGMHLDVVQ